MWNKTLGWLLGLDDVSVLRIEDIGLGASWAQGNGFFWVFFGSLCLITIALMFYLKFQTRGPLGARIGLAVCRGLLLVLLLVTLADPFIQLYDESYPRPLLYVLFDGTESMSIEDELNDEQTAALAKALNVKPEELTATPKTRSQYVQTVVARGEGNLLKRLEQEKKLRIEAFVFEGTGTSQLRRLEMHPAGRNEIEPQHLAEQITTSGQVTAIGTVIDELNQQLGKGNLAGVVMFSDYGSNSGVAPVGDDRQLSPVARLKVPIHTVGIGNTEAVDLAVDMRPELKMKRAERSSVNVKWSQTGLKGKTVTIRVTGQRLEGTDTGSTIDVGERTVALDDHSGDIILPFTPKEAGRIEFIAEVDVQDGEVVSVNNRSTRPVNVVDDYLRLMYVAYEPSWEWRFVKEVFHRDKLVGMRGFRTFLRSADPKVREYNDLFLPTLTPKRSEFFANDIIFLGDMPGSALSQRFCELTKEFVSEFGGGLVVMAGPRFGPGQLAGTPLADMLPVEPDPGMAMRDQREFTLRLTPIGLATDFMQLGDTEQEASAEAENINAWRNMGPLPWYQPVRKPSPLAEVLAEHPTDTCVDGETKQPLIAIRRYGKGEVVYIAFDEMWRLRRRYGERYYRQFWSQLMNRLALSHALGNQKRFVVRTDRQKYTVDDKVTVVVEAYDENFERLRADKVTDGKLVAEMFVPGSGGKTDEVTLTPLRPGEFEARVPVSAAGEYRLRVKDPIEDDYSEVRFNVENLSAERRTAQRNEYLQKQIARESGGNSYELTNVSQLVDDIQVEAKKKISRHNKPLWATPLWFILVVGLMLGEWFTRKMLNLT